jgi:hypothetical protein
MSAETLVHLLESRSKGGWVIRFIIRPSLIRIGSFGRTHAGAVVTAGAVAKAIDELDDLAQAVEV